MFKSKKPILVLGMILLFLVITVSILRERIVSEENNQVTVMGQGRVSYVPDMATITLGVQVDKVWAADEALRQMNDKVAKIMEAVKAQGAKDENITTNNYSLYPQYDYVDGRTNVSGYNANQQLVIKIDNISENKEMVGKVISAASAAGANQILGVNFSVSNVNDLKQEARLKAMADAKSKSGALLKASGVRARKVVGWYENVLQTPDANNYPYYGGIGGAEGMGSRAASVPQVPSGAQEIVIEVGLSYKVK